MLLWLGLKPGMVQLQNPCFFDCYRQLRQLGIPWASIDSPDRWNQTVETQYIQLRGNAHIPTAIEQSWVEEVRQTNKAERLIIDDSHGFTTDAAKPVLRGNEFYVGSFSKLFGPGLRLGYLLVPTSHLHAIKAAKIAVSLSTSGPVQYWVSELLHMEIDKRQTDWYSSRRQEWLASGLPFDEWSAGVQLRLDTRPGFAAKLAEEFQIDDNHWYWNDPQDHRCRQYLRLNYTLHEPGPILDQITALWKY